MRRRTRVLVRDAATTAGVLAVVAGLAVGGWRVAALVRGQVGAPTPHHPAHAGGSPTGHHGTASSKASPAAGAVPALGVYTGPGAVSQARSVDVAVGGKVSYALDFQPATTWTDLSDPSWITRSWAFSSFGMVLAVPMLPSSGGTLGQGALGTYDQEFTTLAQRLVAGGLGDAVLMVGWQPESGNFPWQVTTPDQAAQYVEFWDQIHAAMSGVTGAHFLFEWDAGTPGTQLTPGQLYPGDAAVDIVAEDAFDVGLSNALPPDQWATLMDKPYGPAWAASFAAAHGKRFALAMCGLAPASADGAGDNAAFLTQALQWARTARASMVMLWDYSTWAITGPEFPQADAALLHAVDQGIVGRDGTGTL